MVGPILEALERKIGLRRDATRAPLRAPEWQRATSMPRPPRNTQISTRPRLTYCGPKLVLTKGSTLHLCFCFGECRYGREQQAEDHQAFHSLGRGTLHTVRQPLVFTIRITKAGSYRAGHAIV